jgi:hypothetical protein
MSHPQNIYSVQLLNDLHNWFPDILYQPHRFQNVQDILTYIRFVANQNPYLRGQAIYNSQMYHGSYSTDYSAFSAQRASSSSSSSSSSSGPFRPIGPIGPRRSSLYTVPDSSASNVSVSNISVSNVSAPDVSIPESLLSNFIQQLIAGTDGTEFSLFSVDIAPENVVIAPTAQQIANATVLTTAIVDHDDNCAICQDELVRDQELRTIQHCSHIFHKTCIDTWFQRNVRCPTCRFDIRET